jgi:hypothetical protein
MRAVITPSAMALLLAAALSTNLATPVKVRAQDVRALEEQLARQQAANEALQAELAVVRRENAELQQRLAEAQKAQDVRLKELVAMQDRLAQDRAQLAEAEQRVQQQLQQADAQLQKSQETVARLQQEVAELRQAIARPAGGVTPPVPSTAPAPAPDPSASGGEPAARVEPPPNVSGLVLSVEDDAVEISLGSDAGLKPGHRLGVFRTLADQSIYVGRIEVTRTAPDKSACKVIPEFERRKVQKGDRVATKL